MNNLYSEIYYYLSDKISRYMHIKYISSNIEIEFYYINELNI